MAELKENAIEWVNGDKTIAVTLSQGRYVSKVKKLAKDHPDEVKILRINPDGSIFAHLPLRALKLNLSSKRELTEEERKEIGKRLQGGKAKAVSDDWEEEGDWDDWEDE